MYHYEECGLPNVWLMNGYKKAQTSHGEAMFIENLLGLHKVIAQNICKSPKLLSGQEFRFLRKEMELSQKKLAEHMGIDVQRIERWEKGRSTMEPLADRLLRQLYSEYTNQTQRITDLIRRLNKADAEEHDKAKIKLKLDDHDRWRPAA